MLPTNECIFSISFAPLEEVGGWGHLFVSRDKETQGASLRKSFPNLDGHLREKHVAQATIFSLAVS